MSGRERTHAGAMRLPDYQPGQDETWDRLGKDWQAVEGVVNGRLYARWTAHPDGRSELSGLCVEAVPVTGELLRSIPVGRVASLPDAQPFDLAELAPLRRGSGERPEDFAARVALHYKIFTQISPHPSKLIAEHSGVPVSTVRGWVHEARLRGKLPPGTPGRAG